MAVKIRRELSYGTLASHCMHGKPLLKSAVVKCPLGAFRGKVTLNKKPEKKE